MTRSRRLTVGQLSHLRRLGAAVLRTGASDREPTIDLVIEAVGVYRAGGASLAEIARALGIEITILGEWMDRRTAKPTPEPLARRSLQQSALGAGVLACTGDGRPAGNDFDRELEAIRRAITPHFTLTERCMIGIVELRDHINAERPRILHLCCHSVDGAVFLTFDGKPVSVQYSQLVQVLRSARHRPSALILNFCGSIRIRDDLLQLARACVCWPDRFDDEHGREFAGILYRALAMGGTLGEGMDDVHMVLPRYSGLAVPHLIGDATVRLA